MLLPTLSYNVQICQNNILKYIDPSFPPLLTFFTIRLVTNIFSCWCKIVGLVEWKIIEVSGKFSLINLSG